jgi:hypothetical protein
MSVLKSNKWLALGMIPILVAGFLFLSSSYLKSQDDITIDNINLGSLIIGDEVTKDDLQGSVVGILVWGKW